MEKNCYFYSKEMENSIKVNCYLHDIAGFRYNWHDTMYEINIVLSGQVLYCVEGQSYTLEKDDVIIINPHCGHASLKLRPDSVAFVIHFSAKAFRPFLEKGLGYYFSFCSDSVSRDRALCRCLRFFASNLIHSAEQNDDILFSYSYHGLVTVLLGMPQKEIVNIRASASSRNEAEELVSEVTEYLEQHFQEKITLENISALFGYNRTYFSTLFKKNLGIGFYEYLIRIRFSKALRDLAGNEKTLTQIAIDNGFPDLNTFNRLFRENFQMSPAKYREIPQDSSQWEGIRLFRSCREPLYENVLKAYLRLESSP